MSQVNASAAVGGGVQVGSATIKELADAYLIDEQLIRAGGGKGAVDRQHEKGRLTARERLELLLDEPGGGPGSGPGGGHGGDASERLKGRLPRGGAERFVELGLWSGWGMYKEYGGAPGAGVVTGIGRVAGRRCMLIANDATVKAGAFFPMTCKKIIRVQQVAMEARLPLVYLVDSAGVFLPLQEDVFPDTDDFGRIFRNNAVISAMGIPQIAAIMGYCVAGGGYLPVLCDTLLMTEGSGLYLAGPALVKAAIGQEVSDEDLGGAAMHAGISGTIDFREKDDVACIARLRSLLGKYPAVVAGGGGGVEGRPGGDVYEIFSDKQGAQYDVRELIGCFVDRVGGRNPHAERGGTREHHAERGGTQRLPEGGQADFDEYKGEFGQSVVCGYARVGGWACGIVANQKKITKTGKGMVQMGGVIYDDSADKGARFIMDCNQRKVPIIFIHDTTGFMVGRESEQGGIIRAGAKMVNAMANCVVPKIVLITGSSYGAGNYAMCGRAFDQFVSLAWPNARCAVMGANQATGVLTTIEEGSRKRKGEVIDEAAHKQIYGAIHASYTAQADIRYAAARGWVDRLIEPHRTREELIAVLEAAAGWDYSRVFRTGVIQT